MLKTIGEYLQNQGFGTVGCDIFYGSMPSEGECITLYSTGGYEGDLCFNSEDNIEYPTFQIIARCNSYESTFNKIQPIYKKLNGNTDIFPLILALQPPESLGQDEQNRWEFSCNFKVTKEVL